MSTRRWELVATDESTVIAEMILDAIVMEDGEGDGGFPDPPWTDESDRFQFLCERNNLLDESATSETGPRRGRRQLSRGNTMPGVKIWGGNVRNR